MTNSPRDDEKIIALNERAAERKRMSRPKLDPVENRRQSRASIAALLFAALLVVVGLFLIHKLGQMSALQDCLMSGRGNCQPIEVPPQ